MSDYELRNLVLAVVEDDPGILRTVADNLRFDRYDVITAMDGETAYALNQSHQPDLIVLDLMLPRMSGLDLCRRLRMEGERPALACRGRLVHQAGARWRACLPRQAHACRSPLDQDCPPGPRRVEIAGAGRPGRNLCKG